MAGGIFAEICILGGKTGIVKGSGTSTRKSNQPLSPVWLVTGMMSPERERIALSWLANKFIEACLNVIRTIPSTVLEADLMPGGRIGNPSAPVTGGSKFPGDRL